MMKQYIPDPYFRRVARMISERLWINRFMMWSSEVDRLTGPGSRMGPADWLGTDDQRAMLGAAISRPIWLNFFFSWGLYDSRDYRGVWEPTLTEITVNDLPDYIQDIALHKTYPSEFKASVDFTHWKTQPVIEGLTPGDPNRPMQYVNYQTENYTLGASTSKWFVQSCIVAASAWWNDSGSKAPVGSPERYCMLFPHYVFNGMSIFDKGDLYLVKDNGKPIRDQIGGYSGPWLREFIEFGRPASIQDRNTLLFAYSAAPMNNTKEKSLTKSQTYRASAAMFLHRWREGLDGLYINKKPVLYLPRELAPGEWWFIHDGEVYAAVRPLKATALKGDCRIRLEKRTHNIVLYVDNVNAENIEGIPDEDWVKAQSGFVVEMGNSQEYSSFGQFRDKILEGTLRKDEQNGFVRSIAYQRGDRKLEMDWNSYTEEYTTRKISGKDEPWVRYAQSPDFAVCDNGLAIVKDARAETTSGNSLWLLSGNNSRNWVVYQSNFAKDIPVTLTCPAGQVTVEKLPFGKILMSHPSEEVVKVSIDAGYVKQVRDKNPFTIEISSSAPEIEVEINSLAYTPERIIKNGKTAWLVNPYSRKKELEKTMDQFYIVSKK